ncbi:MAG: MCE family protein [Aeromicrobium sp.]|uniref:MCE family protein n=1 Tax=Aeromicrobium sp. TaxID=1871063 RepID=UPI0026097FBC|nr:MCE family protein [Aeromicrobium sp.]MDF1704250.1 MCE family protein [Aeromicrobium sp.]
MIRTRRTIVAAVVSAVLASGCGYGGLNDLPLPGAPDVGDDPYRLELTFEDVRDLAPSSTVRLDGVTVGRVDTIRREGWTAVVTVLVDDETTIPSDAVARVSQTSLLGEKFVEFVVPPGSAAAPLADGDAVTLASTGRGVEVEEVLGALSLLLNGGGIAQLQTISSELHQALDAGTVDTTTFLTELDAFVGTLDENRGTIIAAMEDVQRLGDRVSANRAQIQTSIDAVEAGTQVLAGQSGEIAVMITALDSFGATASDVVSAASADLQANLQSLQPVLEQLALAGDRLPRALEIILTFPFPDEMLGALKGDYVNLDLEIDLTPLLLLSNLLSPEALLETATSLPGLFTVPPTPTDTDGAPAPAAAGAPSPAPAGSNQVLPELLSLLLGGGR